MGMLNSVCLLIICRIIILAADGNSPSSVVLSVYAARVLTEVPLLPLSAWIAYFSFGSLYILVRILFGFLRRVLLQKSKAVLIWFALCVADGWQFKIRVSPSTPRRDHTWTVSVPPPPSVTEINYQSMTVTTNRTCGSVGSPPWLDGRFSRWISYAKTLCCKNVYKRFFFSMIYG